MSILTIATTPIPGMKPGISGLRKKVNESPKFDRRALARCLSCGGSTPPRLFGEGR